MGFRINTNTAAMNAHMYAQRTNIGLDKSLTALSSGLRITKAADDASGMAIADSLKQQALGLGQAVMNANDAIGVVQTADGALDEYINIVNTIRTKAIQAASDGQNTKSREAIQKDIDRLLEEAQNIASTTSFNGQFLLDGSYENKAYHIGAYSGETVNISISAANTDELATFAMVDGTGITATNADTGFTVSGLTINDATSTAVTIADITVATGSTSLEAATEIAQGINAQADDTSVRASVFETSTAGVYGVRLDSAHTITTAVGAATEAGIASGSTNVDTDNNLRSVDVTTRDEAEQSIIKTDYALVELDEVRADLGSVQNQLESTIRNISITQVNVTAAESQIRDVDFAAESANFAKLNILAQSGSYAMSQANAIQQNVLRLLQ
jgi:flagellin